MRFVFAIAAFVVAAAMIAGGIAQRTIFAPPDTISAVTTVKAAPAFTVIDGSVLNANPGRQTLSVTGTGEVFMAYARTSDVKAWLGDEQFANITINMQAEDPANILSSELSTATSIEAPPAEPATGGETQAPATPAPDPSPSPAAKATDSAKATEVGTADGADSVPGPNPAGSDLWLEEFHASQALIQPLNIPEDMSVLIANDGTQPAPGKVRISWPLQATTPWAGPLIVGGGILLLVGLGLYVWAWRHMRRSRGPRRSGGPKMPKPPKAPKPVKPREIETPHRGRRAITRSFSALIPVTLTTVLVLTGCSPDSWPDLSQSASPAPIDAPAEVVTEPIPVAVSTPQLETILRRIADVTRTADADRDKAVAAERLTGSALAMREANYKIRGKVKDYAALPPIPSTPLTLSLPQATDSWPRTVFTIVQDKENTEVAPTAMFMTQASPRDNYRVEYAVSLEPDVTIPKVAPPSIGAPIVAPDSKLLLMPPNKLAMAYSDILDKGKKSEYYSIFRSTGDSLRDAVGFDYKEQKRKDLPDTAKLEFTSAVGDGPTLALGTNDSGAIVAVDLTEVETVKPVKDGATVEATGAAKVLSGIEASTKGITTTYLHQLLFYVPSIGSSDKIVLLGFSQSLMSSSEIK